MLLNDYENFMSVRNIKLKIRNHANFDDKHAALERENLKKDKDWYDKDENNHEIWIKAKLIII